MGEPRAQEIDSSEESEERILETLKVGWVLGPACVLCPRGDLWEKALDTGPQSKGH